MLINLQNIKKIIPLALPITLAQASQTIVNLIDTVFVSRLGDSALAAVGLGGFACQALQALLLCLAVGVQALTSRRKGAGALDIRVTSPLSSALTIAFVGGILLTVILYPLIPHLYPLINSDPKLISQGVPYLQIRIMGSVFIAMGFCFGGYWNALQRPLVYLSILITVHLCNIALSYGLILGHWGLPSLGVRGAAIGTSVSWIIGCILHLVLTCKKLSWPKKREIIRLLSISLPTGVQYISISMGFTVFYWILGSKSTHELAAGSVIINILQVALMLGLGVGMGTATLVGQEMGRGKIKEAALWGWSGMQTCLLFLLPISILLIAFAQPLLALFILSPLTKQLATIPLILTLLIASLDAAGLCVMFSLLGTGDTKRVMLTSLSLQWGLFLPLAYYIGLVLDLSLNAIWIWFILYRTIQALAFCHLWYRGKWKNTLLENAVTLNL